MSYDRYERRQVGGASTRRGVLGYWLPLALTVTAATVGIAVWIWSERKDDELDDYERDRDSRPPSGPPPEVGGSGLGQAPYTRRDGGQNSDDEGMMAKMSGALRRTPSPQQLFDGASRRVAAGVAAAGAVVNALSSIREEDKRDFEDHSRWSEEAESRLGGGQAGIAGDQPKKSPSVEPPAGKASISTRDVTRSATKAAGKQKTVAIVVSAVTAYHNHGDDVSYLQEHASILSHLPRHINGESRLFVLIYAPDLQQHPLAAVSQVTRPPISVTSSYSNIGHEEAQDHGEEGHKPLSLIDPVPVPSPPRSKKFEALYKEAQSLVGNDTLIMPFTTPTGHIQLLRHIAPEIVYVQETLSGSGGDVITSISNWIGQTVLVVGDESGHGGLVDSEDERENSGEGAQEKWWQNDPRIGLGKGVEVVEGLRIGEDWRRRVGGHD